MGAPPCGGSAFLGVPPFVCNSSWPLILKTSKSSVFLKVFQKKDSFIHIHGKIWNILIPFLEKNRKKLFLTILDTFFIKMSKSRVLLKIFQKKTVLFTLVEKVGTFWYPSWKKLKKLFFDHFGPFFYIKMSKNRVFLKFFQKKHCYSHLWKNEEHFDALLEKNWKKSFLTILDQ